MDSIFNLQRPYDLMALLKQEERAEMLESLKDELLSRKGDIDGSEDGDSGLWLFLSSSVTCSLHRLHGFHLSSFYRSVRCFQICCRLVQRDPKYR